MTLYERVVTMRWSVLRDRLATILRRRYSMHLLDDEEFLAQRVWREEADAVIAELNRPE